MPDNTQVLIDLSSTSYVDLDNIDIINAFIKGAVYRGITVSLRGDIAGKRAALINAPSSEVLYT